MAAVDQDQLALGVQLRDDATWGNFLPLPGQAAVLAAIRAQLGESGEPVLFLHGGADAGKSHLLQAACLDADGQGLYLPLRELAAHRPEELLQGLESMPLLCLDDLQAVAGQRDWELALFHLFNRCRESGARWLASGRQPPRELALTLPDLESRLGWGPVFALAAPDDQRRQAILQHRARCRGLDMPQEVARYLVTHTSRALDRLLDLLDALDHRSLQAQRGLTIPFVRQILQEPELD